MFCLTWLAGKHIRLFNSNCLRIGIQSCQYHGESRPINIKVIGTDHYDVDKGCKNKSQPSINDPLTLTQTVCLAIITIIDDNNCY